MKEYEVTINFGGYLGCDKTYTVYADDENEASITALEEAECDLSVESVEEVDSEE